MPEILMPSGIIDYTENVLVQNASKQTEKTKMVVDV